MATVLWRPEVNALTIPQSYRARVLPRNVIGNDELAAEIAAELDVISPELARLVITTEKKLIAKHLANGDQVTQEDALTYSVSLSARLENPDDPLPDDDDMLKVRIYASRPFNNVVRKGVIYERSSPVEKVPVIASAEDKRLKLNDVLFAQGVLKLTGSNLFFDEIDGDGQCVLEGTQSGSTIQSQYALISNSSILLVPDIPAQDEPWNNEYTVSVTTHYTEHGTARSGTYRGRLRSPRTVTISGEGGSTDTGILTGSANAPYVTIDAVETSEDERIRIQAVLDIYEERLLFRLLDMSENGKEGAELALTANGGYALSGFAGSSIISVNIQVNNYAELVQMIRNDYKGRLVDILDVQRA